MILMIFPFLHQQSDFLPIKTKALNGFSETSNKPDFSVKSWFYGDYQENLTSYLNINNKLRPPFVRINNQIDFSLFNKTNAVGVVLGKNNQCFQADYIYEYNGEFFVGEKLLDERLYRLHIIQDSLKNHGVEFLVILAPGKEAYMPENIPDSMRTNPDVQTNYKYLAEQMAVLGIQHIDLNKHFSEMKDTVSWPLFPTYGIHWSEYGAYLAQDTFLTTIRNLTGKFVPELDAKSLEISNIPRLQDDDLGKLMNLAVKLPETNLAYPQFDFSDTLRDPELDILFIGDSFLFHWLQNPLPEYLYRHFNFWYYNVMVYPQFYEEEVYNYDFDFLEQTLSRDIIVLECTDRFLYTAFWKFEELLYSHFTPEYSPDMEFYHINDITKDHNQFIEVVHGAWQRGISIEDAIWEEAKRRANETPTLGSLEFYIKSIKDNPDWLSEIEEQAQAQGVDVEEMIRRNAQWMLDNKKDD